MGITKVTRNFQVTLPKDVREMEKINIGDKFIVTIEDDEIIMKKIKSEILDRSFGVWGKGSSGVEFTRKIRDEAEEREKRLGI
ncbi:MAG: AbrB/MazE/SpoVT family DNA-binding domain-containing protein [Candidatus Aenigmarchaeota archaeon]|nr:AbrB/MazE/SpoVT family DNA-binding domain-containing protein [Candidatus Aenigmarchaeota archaeon]